MKLNDLDPDKLDRYLPRGYFRFQDAIVCCITAGEGWARFHPIVNQRSIIPELLDGDGRLTIHQGSPQAELLELAAPLSGYANVTIPGIGKVAVLASRTGQRQWRRGFNTEAFSTRQLTERGILPAPLRTASTLHKIAERLYFPQYIPLSGAVKMFGKVKLKKPISVAVSRNVAITENLSVFYRLRKIGKTDKLGSGVILLNDAKHYLDAVLREGLNVINQEEAA